MSNTRKIRAKRNLKKLNTKRFRVIVTRDTTESAIIELNAPDRSIAAENALHWANGGINHISEYGGKVVQKWADDENYPKKAYLGDPDISIMGGKRTIKGGSVEEIK